MNHLFRLIALILCSFLIINVCGEICPAENCLTPDKCEELIKGDTTCPTQGESCCSVVKSEFRTHCRHHGGECMDSCAKTLIRENAIDCAENQHCCVLVK
ncbi:hypothetical protein HCN44_000936 [Aphidius gifuensis]|uniref:Uncharacterized protein n=1 Tax=Aphidius gifuensis TaxID=684658 RepID=A0A834XJK7_APHGI|nr:hypothetical protein HCN44_000936 [Aphidius gifuensis]